MIHTTTRRFFMVLIVTAFSNLPSTFADDSAKPKEVAKQKTVTLTVDYGDNSQRRFIGIPWKEGMTVHDAMKVVEKHKRGVKFVIGGKRAIALLTKIDDLKNQGGSKLNWVFRVNNKLGETSFGIAKLKPGDDVLWKFDEYR